jgi:chemotaxis protein MotB
VSSSAKGAKKIIIIKKKKAHGGGHHGGSWKVAYADFVTAMMAFFMVMWILGMDDKVKQAIEGYFANPVGYKKGYGAGSSPIGSGESPASRQRPPLRLVIRSTETRKFSDLAERLRAKVAKNAGLQKLNAKVEVSIQKDGLRVELIETGTGETFFPSGSALMKPVATLALQLITTELMDLNNSVIVEGHTDAAPFGHDASYTNWELSADRANAARRVLEAGGLPRARLIEVRGLADKHLRLPNAPLDPQNRRISILLPFNSLPEQPEMISADSLPPRIARGGSAAAPGAE